MENRFQNNSASFKANDRNSENLFGYRRKEVISKENNNAVLSSQDTRGAESLKNSQTSRVKHGKYEVGCSTAESDRIRAANDIKKRLEAQEKEFRLLKEKETLDSEWDLATKREEKSHR